MKTVLKLYSAKEIIIKCLILETILNVRSNYEYRPKIRLTIGIELIKKLQISLDNIYN